MLSGGGNELEVSWKGVSLEEAELQGFEGTALRFGWVLSAVELLQSCEPATGGCSAEGHFGGP